MHQHRWVQGRLKLVLPRTDWAARLATWLVFLGWFLARHSQTSALN